LSASKKKARPYAGRTPEERRAERVTRLRAAGLTLFGTVGFGATRIQSVCTEAHVTARHFYQLYPSTEALFRDVYDEVSGGCLLSVVRSLNLAHEPGERVRDGVRAAVNYLLSDPRRARVQCVESFPLGPEFLVHRNEVLARFATVLASEALREHSLPLSELQVRLTSSALVSAADSLVAAHVHDPEGVSQDDVYESMSYLLLRAAGLA
jgi:AcrR family transcriptional regulator